jgi:GNAT superfamily N-acetyltransferase
MPTEVAVRPATAADVPFLVDCQLAMARETEGLELDPAVLAQGVDAVFRDPRKGCYWLAGAPEDEDRLAGCLLTTYEWSDWRNRTVLWVQSVYVVPAARGQGVFRQLYEHLRSMVEGRPDLAGIRLYVDRRNAAAQYTYERLGMSREHYDLYEWLKPA